VQITRTFLETMFTGPAAMAAGLAFFMAGALLVLRRHVPRCKLLALLGAIGLVVAGAFILFGVWHSVHDVSSRSCGCDPSPDVVAVHDQHGVHLVGTAGILAIIGLAVSTVPPEAAGADDGVNRPLGW
jgi:hypothetical protein